MDSDAPWYKVVLNVLPSASAQPRGDPLPPVLPFLSRTATIGGRAFYDGPLLYTQRGVEEVKKRGSEWLSGSAKLRLGNRLHERTLVVLEDEAGQHLRELGLVDDVIASAEAWFAAECPSLKDHLEVKAVSPDHPAYVEEGQPGFPSLGVFATSPFPAGHLVTHYSGLLCTSTEWALAPHPPTHDYTYDIDRMSPAVASPLGRSPLCLDGAPSLAGRDPTPFLGGLSNGQKGMPDEVVNLAHVTTIGTRCCTTCPPFPHPHIFHVAKKAIAVGEEVVVNYGDTFFTPHPSPAAAATEVRVQCRFLRGVFDAETFRISLEGGTILTPPEFEALAGLGGSKSWRKTIQVLEAPGFANAPCKMQVYLLENSLEQRALELVAKRRRKEPTSDDEADTKAAAEAVTSLSEDAGEKLLATIEAASARKKEAYRRASEALAEVESMLVDISS